MNTNIFENGFEISKNSTLFKRFPFSICSFKAFVKCPLYSKSFLNFVPQGDLYGRVNKLSIPRQISQGNSPTLVFGGKNINFLQVSTEKFGPFHSPFKI